jgi:hypothetical protein
MISWTCRSQEKYIFAVRQKNTGESAERAWRTELEEENARIRETYDKVCTIFLRFWGFGF